MKRESVAVLVGKKKGEGSIILVNGNQILVDNEFPDHYVGDQLYIEEILPEKNCTTCGESTFYDQQEEEYYCPVHD